MLQLTALFVLSAPEHRLFFLNKKFVFYMQLDTHEHFSKSRNFAESDKTISSSVVKMKSVLQVTMTLI